MIDWTDIDNAIHAFYADHGAQHVADMLPSSSIRQIRNRAERLGIKVSPAALAKIRAKSRTISSKWREADNIIREYYPDNGAAYVAKLIGHLTADQIKRRASVLRCRLKKTALREIKQAAWADGHITDTNVTSCRAAAENTVPVRKPAMNDIESLAAYLPWRANTPRALHEAPML